MRSVLALPFAYLAIACGSEGESPAQPDDGSEEVTSEVTSVDVAATTRTFLKLAPLGPAELTEDGSASTEWDLAFLGWDVFTNGGVSGPGDGAAFGPLDAIEFALPGAPEVPFLQQDEPGGAFRDWYAYDGTTHSLFSRFHRYGVSAGWRLYKLQILGYYGELAGAPVSALYALRYAEVTASGSTETRTLEGIDATAGWPNVTDASASACVNLERGEVFPLTPAEARASTDWQLCFRRDGVSVNGEAGGPGGVSAADLDAESDAEDELTEIKTRTAESELARFEALDFAALRAAAPGFRGDRVISVFSDVWVNRRVEPPAPRDATWLVTAADGVSRFLLYFESLADSTGDAAGSVTLRVRSLP